MDFHCNIFFIYYYIMKTIELALEPVHGYLISINRNNVNDWYEIEIGLPNTWVFDENKKIGCEVLEEYETGKIIKITPKVEGVVIDDLISFVEIIILTNLKISEKEKEFKVEMEEMKVLLEKKASKYLEELDVLKEKSFQNENKEFVKSLEKPKTKRKPRITKAKPLVETQEKQKNNDLLELDGQVTTSTSRKATTTVTEKTSKN